MSNPAGDARVFRRAFSLVELVMVIVIIAMLASIAAPRFANATERYRVQLAAARLQADLLYARERAMATGKGLSVVVDPDAGTYTIGGAADPDHLLPQFTVNLAAEPYGVRITSADFGGTAKLNINGFGVPGAGGTIRLSGGAGDVVVTIEAGTGAVTVSKLGDGKVVAGGAAEPEAIGK